MSRIKDHKNNRWISGEHLAICERTGRVCLASDLRKEWTGKWVHKDWWEPKHPSLIYKDSGIDKTAAPQPVRPQPVDQFVDVLDANAYWDDDIVEGDDDLDPANQYIDQGIS